MTPGRDSLSGRHLRLGLALSVAISTLAVGIGSVTAQESPTDPGVVADVHESGAVDLTVVLTYDLSTATERSAFDSLQSEETIRQEIETRFADRMDRVASASAEVTGRDVTVGDVSVAIETTDSTGVVRLTATLTNLAAVDGDQITLTQPFAEGFQTDQEVRITVPEGYEIDSVAPEPAARGDDTLTYAPAASLDGFELVASEGTAGTTGTSVPGMGLLVGGIALTGTSILAVRRR